MMDRGEAWFTEKKKNGKAIAQLRHFDDEGHDRIFTYPTIKEEKVAKLNDNAPKGPDVYQMALMQQVAEISEEIKEVRKAVEHMHIDSIMRCHEAGRQIIIKSFTLRGCLTFSEAASFFVLLFDAELFLERLPPEESLKQTGRQRFAYRDAGCTGDFPACEKPFCCVHCSKNSDASYDYLDCFYHHRIPLALESAVYLDDLSVDERGVISCEEESYRSDVLRLSDSLARASVDHSLKYGRSADAVYHGRVDGARSDGIDSDLRSELPCHGLGKSCHGVLGGDVSCEAVVSCEGSNGSNVYDHALALSLHDRCYELAESQCGVNIDSEYSVPLFHCYVLKCGHAQHSGVVDENVYCTVSFNCLVNDLFAEVQIRSIAEDVHCLISLSLDLFDYSLGTLFISSYNYDLGTFLCEKNCCCSSHSGGCACNDCYLVFKSHFRVLSQNDLIKKQVLLD